MITSRIKSNFAHHKTYKASLALHLSQVVVELYRKKYQRGAKLREEYFTKYITNIRFKKGGA